MEKGSITISVPNNITVEDLKEIRQQFKNTPESKHYRLNILISGNKELKFVIKDVLLSQIKK